MTTPQTNATQNKRPPRQERTGLTSTGVRKAGSKSGRSRAREFELQALYQHLVGGNAAGDIGLTLASSLLDASATVAISPAY